MPVFLRAVITSLPHFFAFIGEILSPDKGYGRSTDEKSDGSGKGKPVAIAFITLVVTLGYQFAITFSEDYKAKEVELKALKKEIAALKEERIRLTSKASNSENIAETVKLQLTALNGSYTTAMNQIKHKDDVISKLGDRLETSTEKRNLLIEKLTECKQNNTGKQRKTNLSDVLDIIRSD